MHPRRIAGTLARGALLLFGLLSLSGTTVEPDVRKVDPRLLHRDAMATGSAPGRTFGAAPEAGTAIPIFLRLREDDSGLPVKFREFGGSAQKVASRTYVGKIPPDALRYVSNWPNAEYIDGAKRVRHMLNLSRPALSAEIVQAGTSSFPPPFNTSGIRGDNVYLGIVDTGLYGGHPDFHTDGTGSSRVVHTYAYSLSTDPLVDEEGHGTHVAGIAAGNGFSSGGGLTSYTGMAPEAALMVGKTSFITTDVVAAVQNLIAFAESRTPPRPVAINLSLGLVTGPNDGTSSFESAINSLASGASGSKRLIAVAAGNEKNQGEHFRTAIAESFGTRTISLNLLSSLSLFLPQVDIWAYGATRDPDPAKHGEYDEYTVTVDFPDDRVTVLSGRSQTSPGGLINVSNRVDTGVPNGATHITISLANGLAGRSGTIRFDRTRNGGTGVIDGYVDMTDGFFLSPALTGNIIEPANGDNVVAVGSFQTKTTTLGSWVPGSLDISSFSSFGPTRDGRLKPDLAAPGEYIFSARSADGSFFPSEIVPGNDNYVIMAGTSMATPHVTGVAALIWQSNPSLTGAQMRERLRRTANPPTDGSTPPNTTWGYGKLSSLRAVQNTVASISAPGRATPGGTISLTSENSSAGFGAAISGYLWSAPGAILSSPDAPGTTFTASTPGIYTVSLTATAGGLSGTDFRNILVNSIPTSTFTVPASDTPGRPATFHSTASDADNGQSLTRHWLVVTRPAGSAASITDVNADSAVIAPDVPGTYEIGLRVDDGLDNSALVVHSYSTLNSTVAPSSSGSGGGGCMSIASPPGKTIDASPAGTSFITMLFSVGILLLPACALGLRRFFRRREGTAPIWHSIC